MSVIQAEELKKIPDKILLVPYNSVGKRERTNEGFCGRQYDCKWQNGGKAHNRNP